MSQLSIESKPAAYKFPRSQLLPKQEICFFTKRTEQGPYIALPEDKVPWGWSNDPDCLLIDLHFVGSQFHISWRIEKELGAAKNVRVMLADEQHTFVLAGLVSKTEAAYFVYNEVTDDILQVTSWKGDLDGFLDRFNGNLNRLPTKLLSS